ncbi:MAG TPA: hypothetical protein VGO39_12325 [Gaiellaceae bacterium]|jgi:hypothetical protein|nr:hypothetical protein [Gaiellaceae bacterium]
MQIPTVAVRQLAAGALLQELALRPGADVVGRAVEVRPDGRGTISIAGALLAARLPKGVAPGDTLPLRVVGAVNGEMLLRVRTSKEEALAPGELARAAGALAVHGDGELLKAAVALQPPGLALPLPNGDAAVVRIADEQPTGGGRREAEGEAAFVLHSAVLGAIEVRLALGGGIVRARVVVEPDAAKAARAAAPELVNALARATSARAAVDVAERTEDEARPERPRLEQAVDRYA